MAPGGFFRLRPERTGDRCRLPCRRQDLTQNSHPLVQSCFSAGGAPLLRAKPYTKTAPLPCFPGLSLISTGTLHKNCTLPRCCAVSPFCYLTQKLQPPRFCALQHDSTSRKDPQHRRTLHKNCTLSPHFRTFFQKALFLPSIPQNRPPPLPFCPAAPAFWHRLTPPGRVRYTKMHPCGLCALSPRRRGSTEKIFGVCCTDAYNSSLLGVLFCIGLGAILCRVGCYFV